MSFITKLLQTIGHFFAGLFNEAEKAYSNLTPEQQAALVNGSGIVDIINSMLTAEAADVRKAIQEKFPNIDEQRLEQGLFAVANSLNLTGFTSVDDCIAALQKHFAGLTGKVWEGASHGAAGILAILFAPPETKFAAIASLLEWVYQHFIKKA